MKKSSLEGLTAYYREAGSWATDRIATLQRACRIAWIIAFAAGLIAVIEAVALIVLMPLKTVVPYTLLVDRTTGFVQALKPLEASEISPDRALVQSMLVQYVIARESFDIATLQADYRKVGLWSADQARNDYLNLMQPTNPAGPLSLYPRSAVVETRVKSVSPLSEGSTLVRFETKRRDAGGPFGPPQAWVAVVQYRFAGEPMSTDDRFLNPLGFQVVTYRRDPESLPQPQPVAPGEPMAQTGDPWADGVQ